eukprot:maker-scaffold_14-snap-gene-8.32-mRNA-1 protein AED:0.02 eAED:0.02 QI:376/1/1/1/1/1/4/345/446
MSLELGMSPRCLELREKLLNFVENELKPMYPTLSKQSKALQKKFNSIWVVPEGLETLKTKAKSIGLWNLFLPKEYPEGAGLSNVEYAHLCEIMGRYQYLPEICNCSAPDTGNMEVLAKYGTAAQKEKWLKPLMEGKIRSVFLMTEPKVASSDATNIETSIVRDGDSWVINGRKWWSSGILDPRCVVGILMGQTDPTNKSQHLRQSQIIVPLNTPGIKVLRPLQVMGYLDEPHGHGEVVFDNVRVPLENIVLGPGRGFEIAQGRLGPGRIHHCMRTIGACEAAIETMLVRTKQRTAFGKKLQEYDVIQKDIADARINVEMCRLLTLKAAAMIDAAGDAKGARQEIAMIKVIVPSTALKIVDDAMQMHGGAGISQDTPLAFLYANLRTLRFADGPDEVHRRTIARLELRKRPLKKGEEKPALFVPEPDADLRPMCMQPWGFYGQGSKL